MRLRPLSRSAVAGLVLLAGVGATGNAAAQAAPRDTLHYVLVGRNENADVYLDFPAADTALRAWRTTLTPQPLSADGPTYLRNVLPITIGGSVVAPGRYQIWIVGTAAGTDLVLTAAEDTTRDTSALFTERARAPLEISSATGARLAKRVTIRTARHGADTLIVVDRSNTRMDITETQMHPASTSALAIWIGDVVLTVPISAR